jgi:hypothetical protein
MTYFYFFMFFYFIFLPHRCILSMATTAELAALLGRVPTFNTAGPVVAQVSSSCLGAGRSNSHPISSSRSDAELAALVGLPVPISEPKLSFDDTLTFNMAMPAPRTDSGKRGPRIDYTKPHHKQRMEDALQAFLALPDTSQGDEINRGGYSRNRFAAERKVAAQTFRDRLKRKNPLAVPKTGKPGLICESTSTAICDGVARLDDFNRAKDTGKILTSINDLVPRLSRDQCSNIWQGRLKKNPVLTNRIRGEASDPNRTGGVTEMAQRAYFITVRRVRQKLRDLSPGTYQGKEYTYWEKHFTLNSDEEGVQASANGTHLIGRKGKKSHLNHSEASRHSATAVRTGSAAGVKGPTWIIGSCAYPYVTTEFLERHGAPAGSFYCANEAAYMTKQTFDENVEKFCRAVRKMDLVIEANPLWWVLLFVDGFSAKVNTPEGQRQLRKHRILTLQAYSHTSQDNQVLALSLSPPPTPLSLCVSLSLSLCLSPSRLLVRSLLLIFFSETKRLLYNRRHLTTSQEGNQSRTKRSGVFTHLLTHSPTR